MKLHLEYYRYQLVPNSTIQKKLFDVNESVEELKQHKNKYFEEIILGTKYSSRVKGELPFKIIYNKDNKFCLLLSNKVIKKVIQSFETKDVISEPYVVIFIDNSPLKQIIAVSSNIEAYSSSNIVINLLKENTQRKLNYHSLSIYFEPIVKENTFWELIEKHNELSWLKFSFIKPNMANISSSFQNDLRHFSDNTNSHRTQLRLEAPTKSSLDNINKKNKDLDSLVKYIEQGGGSACLKFKKTRKVINTNDSIKTEEVETSLELEHASFQEIAIVLNSILEND